MSRNDGVCAVTNRRFAYPLYTGLILLRMFIYFGLAVSSPAWYYAKIKS